MAINENYLDIAPKGRSQSASVLHPIHEAAMKIADIGLNRSRHKTRDLVNLLLCHGDKTAGGPDSSVAHMAGLVVSPSS